MKRLNWPLITFIAGAIYGILMVDAARASDQFLIVKWSGVSCKPVLIAPSFIEVPLPSGCTPDGFVGEIVTVQVAQPTFGFVSSVPDGIQCGSSALWAQKCSDKFKFDAQMVLKAAPNTGHHFDHWSGCSVSNNAVIQVIPHSVSKPCIANFK